MGVGWWVVWRGEWWVRPLMAFADVLLTMVVALPLALFAVPATVVGVWAGEAFAPTSRQDGVVTWYRHTQFDKYGGYSTKVHARMWDGRALDISNHPDAITARGITVGEPVVVTRSRLTGRVVGVRTVQDHADYRPIRRHTAFDLLSLVFLVLVTVAALAPAAMIAPSVYEQAPAARLTVTAIYLVVVAATVTVTCTLWLHSPRLPATEPLPDTTTDQAPPTGRIGQYIETADHITLTVTAPPVTTPPDGAPGWLHAFHIVAIPVTTAFAGDAHGPTPAGARRISLAGTGPGHAAIVTAGPCAAPLRPFRGTVTASSPPATGAFCFAVPPGFQPHYLIIDQPPGHGSQIRVSLS